MMYVNEEWEDEERKEEEEEVFMLAFIYTNRYQH